MTSRPGVGSDISRAISLPSQAGWPRHANRKASRGRGAVVCRGFQGDNGIPPPWPPVGPKNEGEGGCGEEPHQEGPHGNRHGTTHRDGTVEKSTQRHEGHRSPFQVNI